MAWVAVNKDGTEYIFNNKPHRSIYENVFQIDDNDIVTYEWTDDKYCGWVNLPKGSIEKLIGRNLTWEDEPVELEQDSYRNLIRKFKVVNEI